MNLVLPRAITLQEQVFEDLLSKINTGQYKPGEKLPAERELISMYGVGRNTIRAALAELEARKVIIKKQGKGAYVRPQTYTQNVFLSGSFTETCQHIGGIPSTKIVGIRHDRAPKRVAEALSLDLETDLILRIERVRLVNDEPCIVEVDYMPRVFDYLLDMNLTDKSLLKIIHDSAGLDACETEEYFSVLGARPEIARLLESDANTPLLEVYQIAFDQAGVPIYANEQIIDSSHYVYAVRTRRERG